VASAAPGSAAPAPNDNNAASSDDEDDGTLDPQQIYDAGKALFDAYAPEDVKRDYEFPSRADWDAFVQRVQQALEGGSLEELAALEPDVRRALVALRLTPQYADYVDWLSERLDLIETARDAVADRHRPRLLAPTEEPGQPKAPSPTAAPAPSKMPPSIAHEPNTPAPTPPPALRPSPSPKQNEALAPDPNLALPYYNTWLARLRDRPKPVQASDLMPLLKTIFSAEGIPPELAWLAEVESSLNPQARSPAGARGLFQLMPATAKAMGLSLFPFDERVQPGKNARAAAKMLHRLHERFDDWPLALAAYNVGETKLAALLKKDQANNFASIANDLPVETRMYVPKVFATLTIRENVAPGTLQNPAHRIDGQTDVTPETATPPQKSPLADLAVD
jgi:membrane-bound lytic murein transglycosylase D